MANASTVVTTLWESAGTAAFYIAWTGDDGNGNVDDGTIPVGQGWYVVLGATVPGAVTVPTNLYDITVEDEYGVDVFGGSLANRSSTASQQEPPQNSGETGQFSRMVSGPLTFKIADASQAVNSATGECIIYCEKRPSK